MPIPPTVITQLANQTRGDTFQLGGVGPVGGRGNFAAVLTYMKDAVTRNKSEKSINSILDYISTSQQVQYDLHSYHP